MGLFASSLAILSSLLASRVKTTLSPQGPGTSEPKGDTHVLESIYVPACLSGWSSPSRPPLNQVPGFHITQGRVCFNGKASNNLRCFVGKAFRNAQ